MNTHYLKRLSFMLLSSALLTVQGLNPVSAMDTDVYLIAPTVQRDDAPNILIIQDNSGSMDTVLTKATRPPYDPSIDYCNAATLDSASGVPGASAGIPSNCSSITGRIYWSTSGNTPQTTDSTWFAGSKNHCEASKGSAPSGSGTGVALAGTGKYGGDYIAALITTTNKKGTTYAWSGLSSQADSAITFVDCKADKNAKDGYPASSVSTNTVAGAYTSSSTSAYKYGSSAPTLYTANYLAYFNNNSLTIPAQTRLDVAKTAIKSLINSNPSLHFGLMVFNTNSNSDSTTPGNSGGRLIMKVDTMDAARQTQMDNVVDSMTAATYTPLAETMYEAYLYFSGGNVFYGDDELTNITSIPPRDITAENPQPASASKPSTGNYISPFKFACQKAYVILVTDGDPTNDNNANSKIQSLINASSCTKLTAGGSSQTDCLNDLSGYMNKNDIYTGLPGNQNVSTFTIGFGGGISALGLALLNDTAYKGGTGQMVNADDATSLNNALQGAVSQILSVNTSFVAPTLSVNAFNKLYNQDDVYFALFQPDSSVAWDGNVKKLHLCNTSDVTAYGCTYGDVIDSQGHEAISLPPASKIVDSSVSYWSLNTSIPDGSDVSKGGAGALITRNSAVPRTLYTYTGSYASLSSTNEGTPVAIVASSSNAVRTAAVADPTILGLPTAATSTDVDTLINWMRGQDAYDQWVDPAGTTTPVHSGNTTESRSWNFADPLHSKPYAMTYGGVTNAFGVVDKTNPITKLFVGTNDGMLRMINASTGAEEWAFIPQELLSQQFNLSQDSNGGHIYGMDASPVFYINDINNDGIIDPAAGDFVYMYVGMGRGGRNIYAFDVTPSSKMTSQSNTVTPKLMWVINGGSGNFTRLGQTWSKPTITRVRFKCTGSVCDDGNPNTDDSQSRMVLLFGGGYDPSEDNSMPINPDSMGNAIFMVDPKTGSRLWWASGDSTATLVLSNMLYSIPSDLALADSNSDNLTDRLYVGDTSGQIWRIDLGTALDVNTNGGTHGYVFADLGCAGGSRTTTPSCSATSNQDRRKFFYPPAVVQANDPAYSSTTQGANYDLITIASGDREDPLDLLTTNFSPTQEAVHNRIYALRDYNYKPGAPLDINGNFVAPTALTDSSLYDATADNLATATGTALTTEIQSISNKQGWFINLEQATAQLLPNGLTTQWIGEKSLAKTVVYGGVLYVTTYIPANDTTATNTCQASEGQGMEYALNYLDGTPMYDLNSDGILDRSAVAGGGIPSEVIVVIRDGGVTGLIGTSGGATTAKVNSALPKYNTFWYDE